MKKLNVMFLLGVVSLAAVLLSPVMVASPGGIGDSDQEYGCVDPCHAVHSSSVITMTASTLEPLPGGSVTVTVTVTGAEADNTPLGVMLLSSLGGDNTQPSATGWTITADTSGVTKFNYNEVQSYAGSATFEWTLTAPSTPGVYKLYAREVHGDGAKYVNDFLTGLQFVVGEPVPPGKPFVLITPSSGSEVSGTITVIADVVSEAAIEYAVLAINGVVEGNLSSAPYAWDVDTSKYVDGPITVNVTAADSNGSKGYREVTLTVNNAAESEYLLSWLATMAAGSVAIVAIVGILIVVALYMRTRLMGGRGS